MTKENQTQQPVSGAMTDEQIIETVREIVERDGYDVQDDHQAGLVEAVAVATVRAILSRAPDAQAIRNTALEDVKKVIAEHFSFGGPDRSALLMKIRALQSAPAQPVERPDASEYKPGEWFEARTIDEMQAFYLLRLPAIREAAKERGYAIGLHGSTRRDFDLMAMQWRDGASDKDTLAHAIAVAACGITREGAYQWEQKPNGRFAVSLPICWTDQTNPDMKGRLGLGHIDLSVIAANQPQQVRGNAQEPVAWQLEWLGDVHLTRNPSVAEKWGELKDAVLTPLGPIAAAPQVAQEEGAREQVVDDLAMMVRRLVHQLEKVDPGKDLGPQALDYLRRKGLQGSPLRSDPQSDAQPKCATCNGWGEIGGPTQDGSYQNDPCPECSQSDAQQSGKDAAAIADVILNLIGSGEIDWTNHGQSYEGEDDGGFNDPEEERNCLINLVRTALAASTTNQKGGTNG